MKKLIGPLVFVAIAVVVGLWYFFGGSVTRPDKAEPVTVSALVGGEKMNLLADPRVIAILKDRYGITLNSRKAGSIEMVTTLDTTGMDALWPSNQIAVEMYRKKGGVLKGEENIFNSPIVLYTYDMVADALMEHGIVEKKSETYYIVDFPKMVRYIQEGKTWKDMGLGQLYGKMAILSTDPTRSNSGNMFSGLLADMFNNGQVVTADTLPSVLPELTAYFSSRGYMEHSSGDIFKNFITTGVGAKPIIVGYENQLVEFSIENEKFIDHLKKKIRTLYPVPTVWSSHPVIALTDNGKRLIEALKDSEIQDMAWERHGFRTGLLGVKNDPAVLKVTGIPKEITSVMPMPDAGVMERIISALSR